MCIPAMTNNSNVSAAFALLNINVDNTANNIFCVFCLVFYYYLFVKILKKGFKVCKTVKSI